MAYLIDLETHTDKRGNLTIIEDVLPFLIRRVFYINGVDSSERGGHMHHKNNAGSNLYTGECKIFNHDENDKTTFHLVRPHQNVSCLNQLTGQDVIFMVLASENLTR